VRAQAVLPAHPDLAAMLQRERRHKAGDASACVDATQPGRIVTAAQGDFERESASRR